MREAARVADSVSHNLALNIRRLREALGLSQQQVASTAQIPRPTWANLESGAANPTLAVLTKVASALNVGLEQLLAAPRSNALHYPAETLPNRRRGRVTARALLPQPPVGLNLERFVFPPGAQMSAGPEAPGYREYLTCETGELELTAGEASYSLQSGDVLMLRADQRRSYRNLGKTRTVAYSILSLAGTELG